MNLNKLKFSRSQLALIFLSILNLKDERKTARLREQPEDSGRFGRKEG